MASNSTVPAFYPALFAEVDTPAGRVRGLVNQGVRIFRGLPYGEPTGGGARYRPPVARAPWPGTRDCFGPGQVAPQVPTPIGHVYGRLIQFDRVPADGGIGEDCLSLNVYAPAEPAPPRPVLVVIHGGGFAIGSANSPLYDGTLMAWQHDMVVVSINHRLGAFGYLALDGEDHAGSHVAGLLDCVLGLEWVRDGIAAFGGDPGRVTLIGQSGGGWKISALLAMPAAQGLFHRAVVQSGSWPRFPDADAAQAMTAALLGEFGLGRGDWRRLLTIDMAQILAAAARVGALGFMPSRDAQFLPWHGDDPQALALSVEVPVIISTTREDAGLFYPQHDLDDATLDAMLAERFGDEAPQVRALYRDCAPTPYLTWARIATDAGFRRLARQQADARAGAGAPTWVYRWDSTCPAWSGRFGAAHAMDVPASLARPEDVLLGGAGPVAVRLASEHSAMIAGFAGHGTPGGPHAAIWPRYDPATRATLIVDETTRVAHDPDGATRALWDARPLPSGVG